MPKFTKKDIEKMQTSGKYGSIWDDIFQTRFFFVHTIDNGYKAVFETVDGKRKMELTKAELQYFYGILI